MPKEKDAILKKYFETNKFPTRKDREELAKKLDVSYAKILNWFRNKKYYYGIRKNKKHI